MENTARESAGKNDFYFVIWWAGMLDGDGCIGLHKQPYKGATHYVPSITWTTTCKKTYDFVDTMLRAGKVGHHTTYRRVTTPNWKDRWCIEIRGMKRCKPVIETIKDYLVTKREEAEALLEFIERRLSSDRNKPYNQIELELVKKIQELKKNR